MFSFLRKDLFIHMILTFFIGKLLSELLKAILDNRLIELFFSTPVGKLVSGVYWFFSKWTIPKEFLSSSSLRISIYRFFGFLLLCTLFVLSCKDALVFSVLIDMDFLLNKDFSQFDSSIFMFLLDDNEVFWYFKNYWNLTGFGSIWELWRKSKFPLLILSLCYSVLFEEKLSYFGLTYTPFFKMHPTAYFICIPCFSAKGSKLLFEWGKKFLWSTSLRFIPLLNT